MRPAKTGEFWWYRTRSGEGGEEWFVVAIEQDKRTDALIAGIAGHEQWVLLENLKGEFRGPIEPPRE